MEEELKNLIKVWVSVIISMSYCYYISTRIKAGVPRLLSVLPVSAMFLVLPLVVSSLHLSIITAFFLTWLANFKLILFCFDKGPLFPLPLTFSQFLCFTCFPIKVQQNPKSQNQFSPWVFTIKVAIFGVMMHYYDYRQNLHPIVLLGFYFVYFYLELETMLTIFKVSVFIFLKCDLEPQFNKPYLATSLQDFWGRRWNVMVPAILRPTVYAPMRRVTERRVSSRWALFPGIMAVFIVSGLIHELIFFYLTREKPTWEVTLFFVLQGICTAVEVAVKKTAVVKRWQVSPVVSRLVTVGFVFLTGVWLFSPQLIRSGVLERFPNETLMFIDFFKNKLITFLGLFMNL